MAHALHQEIRRDVASALGEAQSQSSWVEAGIAVEIVRQRLERHLQHVVFHGEDGAAVRGDQFIRSLMKAS